jgi:translation initiation factor 3 subunit G
VFLKLSTQLQEEVVEKKVVAVGAKILCRICKGDHWTSKCPYKDTYLPVNEIAAGAAAATAALEEKSIL